MYYNGTSKTKSDGEYHHLIIDGIHSDTFRSYTGVFYQYIKNKGFKHIGEFDDYVKDNKKSCILVSYIKLDFIVFKRVFIYDYHGTIDDNKDTLSTNKSE